MKYLYGTSVQGIQNFIFETNKLQEIAGASEIVEQICTEKYKEFIDKDKEKVEVLIAAAGNIKLLAESKDDLVKIVRSFPKAVQEFAPGITISQAVIPCISDKPQKKDFILLEQKLRIQRNKPIKPTEITALGIERSRRTGKSAVLRKDRVIDRATLAKINSRTTNLAKKLSPDNFSKFPKDFSNITKTKNNYSWLAVIHADGNSLGKIIMNLEKIGLDLNTFSQRLNDATIKSAKIAFESIIIPAEKNKYFPFSPIIIGGDDLTVICRADLALDFIKKYLLEFEQNTEKNIGKKITACAGISFVKEKYPFHYAIHLAEELCGVAKKKSKNIDSENVPASIAFHKIQSSFVDSYKEIKERELFAKSSNVRFDFGPYGLDDKINDLPSINELIEKVKIINEDEAPKSGIRKWLTELHNNKGTADQLMDRIIQITDSKYSKKLELEKNKNDSKTILYDVLTIASLEGGE